MLPPKEYQAVCSSLLLEDSAVATLPANDPARQLSLSSQASVRAIINDATRRNLFTGHVRKPTEVARPAELVFGGSYPIDEPLSPRENTSAGGASNQARAVSLKTYPVDDICCVPPNLCKEHSVAAYYQGLDKSRAAPMLSKGFQSNRINPSDMLPLHDDKLIDQYLKTYYPAGEESEDGYESEEDVMDCEKIERLVVSESGSECRRRAVYTCQDGPDVLLSNRGITLQSDPAGDVARPAVIEGSVKQSEKTPIDANQTAKGLMAKNSSQEISTGPPTKSVTKVPLPLMFVISCSVENHSYSFHCIFFLFM